MNISRIDSERGIKVGITSIRYWVEYQRRENPSPVKVNISRIDSERGTIGFTTTGYWVEDHSKRKSVTG